MMKKGRHSRESGNPAPTFLTFNPHNRYQPGRTVVRNIFVFSTKSPLPFKLYSSGGAYEKELPEVANTMAPGGILVSLGAFPAFIYT